MDYILKINVIELDILVNSSLIQLIENFIDKVLADVLVFDKCFDKSVASLAQRGVLFGS